MKRLFALLALLTMLSLFPVTIASAYDDRLVDNADLLTDDEESKLQKRLDDMSEKYDMNVIVVTVPDMGDAISSQDFADLWFENGDYGAGKFLGMELSASGVNWILRHDGVREMYHPHEFASEEERQEYLALEQSWLQAIDELERTAVLHFADGSSMAVNPPLSSEPAGDRGKDKCIFGHNIDPSQVVAVTLGGQTFEIP